MGDVSQKYHQQAKSKEASAEELTAMIRVVANAILDLFLQY
jgi:hypothetical protein